LGTDSIYMARLCHNQRKIASHFSPFTWLHFLAIFQKSATKFNALQFSQEGSWD
jgi:hypothetical protein